MSSAATAHTVRRRITSPQLKKRGQRRFATQTVTCYRLQETSWVKTESFDDATIRDQGRGGQLDSERAMLRAYSNDPNFCGDEKYQRDNGIELNDEGWLIDCDGDLALRRIEMVVVISKHNYGHGAVDYVGLVGEAEGGFFDGRGHIEKWSLRNHPDYDLPEDEE